MTEKNIGYSRLGRPIRLLRQGESDILLVGGIHAREHITSDLLALLCEYYRASNLSFDCIPCLNPDGAMLAKEGILSVHDKKTVGEIRRLNGGSVDFRLWKANAVGVDLNTNFDADWGKGKKNVRIAGPENYIGPSPESESETKAVCALIRAKRYALVVSYHCLGEEVYWGYGENNRFFDQAQRYARAVGYPLKRSDGSCGGLKDWYAKNFDGLGLTVEVGKDEWGHPCPKEKLVNIAETHLRTLPLLVSIGGEIARTIHDGSFGGSKKSI